MKTPASSFSSRHIGPRGADIDHMVKTVGFGSLDELISAAVPKTVRQLEELQLPQAATEAETLAELQALAEQNITMVPMLGQGYYGTHTPSVILRNVMENPAWYTAYTPYQPEISQGRLEALINFQTMVSDLTGLALANASLLDESTAAAEAVTLMRRANRAVKDGIVIVDQDVFAQTLAVMQTRCEPLDIELVVADLRNGSAADALNEAAAGRPVAGVLVQYPGASGRVAALADVVEAAHGIDAMVTVIADLLSLALLQAPGSVGADVAVGTTQRFGVPLGFGGPHAGYMAVRGGLERHLPGRIVGVSVDASGAPAYRLALQTREQHIRREKATSNICTSQVLLAVMAAMYGVYHGPDGLRAIAAAVHGRATELAAGLRASGVGVVHDHFFDTVLARVPGRAYAVVAAAQAEGILVHQVDADHVGVACDETTTAAHVAAVLRAFGAAPAQGTDVELNLPADLIRTDEFMTHEVFHLHRSETAMMRYLRRLSDLDYALDRGMIPLGSCTMKLNAATEMEAVTWPEFAGLHPFAPLEHTVGTRELIDQLQQWLCAVTGYAAVSVQPNAGSQGELAGLLAIRGYLKAKGEEHRTVCLIPSSAHGTNAASAIMAGMRVVVVGCEDNGDVDLADLRAKIDQHAENLAAIMVTYPSTHGVFEEGITEICERVHAAGGQVYVDGANLNALVGVAAPGGFGADVSHLNLHKTFAIPHGGGGPGVGPVAVAAHLADHLPNHPLCEAAGPSTGVGPISGAPFGSAGVLPISWAYIRMMGAEGLKHATSTAILAANYVAARLKDAYPVLFTGTSGLVAHECILDLRPLAKSAGISVDDVAKRLMDFGFHAPTMSFPVAGTLMVEPTESEDLAELDRFCDAMLQIRDEIAKVESGEWDAADNPLTQAPHTASSVVSNDWAHAYSRELAAYPGSVNRRFKYWPPVRRVDNAHGDRNLACTCPPPEAFA